MSSLEPTHLELLPSELPLLEDGRMLHTIGVEASPDGRHLGRGIIPASDISQAQMVSKLC